MKNGSPEIKEESTNWSGDNSIFIDWYSSLNWGITVKFKSIKIRKNININTTGY